MTPLLVLILFAQNYSNAATSVTLTAIGGGADDRAAIQNALSVTLAGGGTLHLDPSNGPFTVGAPGVTLASNVSIVGVPGKTVVNSTVGFNNGTVLNADAWNGRTAATTLATTIVTGSKFASLNAAGGIVVGSEIFLSSNSQGVAGYTVTAVAAAWLGSHAYLKDDVVINGGKSYRCITAGTSAASGGPTGTGLDITDGTVHWAYVGTGPSAIRVERPIAKPFASGDSVSITGGFTGGFPKRIELSGFKITGSADIAIEFIGGEQDIYLHDLEVSGTWRLWAWNFDYGALRSHAVRISGQNNSIAWFGGIESGEDSSIEDCSGVGPASIGYYLNHGIGSRVWGSSYHGANNGVQLNGESPSDTTGSEGGTIVGGNYDDNLTSGVAVLDGSTDVRIVGVQARRNPYGVIITTSATTTPPSRTSVIDSDLRGSTTAGVQIAGGTGHTLRGLNVSQSNMGVNGAPSYAMDGLTIEGLIAWDTVSNAINLTSSVSTSRISISNVNIKRAGGAAIYLGSGVNDTRIESSWFEDNTKNVPGGSAIQTNGLVTLVDSTIIDTTAPTVNNYKVNPLGGDLTLDGVTWVMPKASVTYYLAILSQAANAVVRVSRSRLVDGGGTGGSRTFYYATAGNYLVRGQDVESSVAETVYNLSGGAQKNHGTVTCNGATGVDIGWGLTGANSRLTLVRQSAGGTPGPAPTYTVTPGTKFMMTCSAGDTSTYAYWVDGSRGE